MVRLSKKESEEEEIYGKKIETSHNVSYGNCCHANRCSGKYI